MTPEVLSLGLSAIIKSAQSDGTLWPFLATALCLAALLALLGRRFGPGWTVRTRALVLAGSLVAGAAISLLPVHGLPISTYLSPFSVSTSPFTILMLFCAGLQRPGWPVPRSASLLVLLASLLVLADLTGFLSFPIYEAGYAGPWSAATLLLAGFLFVLVCLIAYASPLVGLVAILPGLTWASGYAHDANLWALYLDLPLVLFCLVHVLSGLSPLRAPRLWRVLRPARSLRAG